MQTHSALYDQIVSGDYAVESRIDMYDRPDKNDEFRLTVTLYSSNPPMYDILITKRRWESNPQYGGRNGTFEFTYMNHNWYYNYGRSGQAMIHGPISNLGILVMARSNWQWHNGDVLSVTRFAKTRTMLASFDDSKIISINPTWAVFVEDSPTVGGCYSAQNRIQLRTESIDVPTMAEFRVFKRVYNRYQTSEWLQHGTFYIDTREPDGDLLTTSFVCYDAMLMTEQIYRELTGIATWPAADIQVMQEICAIIGISVDLRNLWNSTDEYKVDYPNDKTMREILSEIAASHCGNFIISYANQLLFIPFKGANINTVHSLDSKWEKFELQKELKPYRQVNIWYDDENAFSYPYPIIDGDAWDSSPIGKVNGEFAFVYQSESGNTPRWMYGDTEIGIGNCGLTYIGTPEEGDIIKVTREQDISITAKRDGRDEEVPVNLTMWDQTYLGLHNGSYSFNYINDPEDPTSRGWYYGEDIVNLAYFGISFSGNSDDGDQLRVTRFDGQRPHGSISSSSEILSVGIDIDIWEDSIYGGSDGTYHFTYRDSVTITQQQSGSDEPTPLTPTNMERWQDYMGETDGTYVFTYTAREWIYTSGPSGTTGVSYNLSDIGLSFRGSPTTGATITVVRTTGNRAWKDGNITVNLVALGISITGNPNVDDVITVVRDMETVQEITGVISTRDISLDLNIETWENTGLGKKDGTFRFWYNAASGRWTYYNGGLLTPIDLTTFGITYALSPDNLDTITVTRESGLVDINAYAIVSDNILEGECSWATQAMVNNIYSYIKEYVYQPYDAQNVILNPVLEPGDLIKRSGTDSMSFILSGIDADQDILYTASINAPTNEEVNHEYEYKSQATKDLSRKVTLGKPYYGTSISREKGILIERSDGQSEALFNSDVFSMRAMIDGVMQDRVYFDPIKGDYVFAGALASDAVFTDSLYAEQGFIAELTVDRLSTSRRIREFLLDHHYRAEPAYNEDNYIDIRDYHISWVTGSVEFDGNEEPIILQAVNRNGNLLYWDHMVHSCTSEGYPLGEDGGQLYATEDDTGFPIQVYQYKEFTKMQGLFESDGTNYAPKMIFGTGDQNGNNICYIYKATDGMHVDYKNTEGNTDSITHYENEDFWRLNEIGIAPVDELPEVPLHDVIYLTPENDP